MTADVGVEAASTGAHRKTVFDAERARLVHQPGSVADQPIPDAVQCLQVYLGLGSHLNEPHGWSSDRLGDGFGVDRIRLVGLHIGLYELGRDDPRVMAKGKQLTREPL